MSTLLYFFRKPQPGYFSIEKIFSEIASVLENQVEVKKIYLPHSKLSLWNVLQNLKEVRKTKGDIYHVTGDAHYLVLGLPARNTLLTIHDCVFMYQSAGIKRWILKYLFLKWPVKHCSIITTISEKSRQEIIRLTGCSPVKVVVVPNPIDNKFSFSQKTFNASCPVILFIGSTPNKNLERVIETIKSIHCILDIVGKIPPHLKQVLEAEKIQYRQSAGLSDEELVNKYIECDMVLFPSTYEGFGLPIIEAQQTGRPVITSNISPMKEVAGEGACLVDPFSVEAIRKAITIIISNDEYREKIIEKGLLNVQQYKPEKIAGLYADLYQRIHNF